MAYGGRGADVVPRADAARVGQRTRSARGHVLVLFQPARTPHRGGTRCVARRGRTGDVVFAIRGCRLRDPWHVVAVPYTPPHRTRRRPRPAHTTPAAPVVCSLTGVSVREQLREGMMRLNRLMSALAAGVVAGSALLVAGATDAAAQGPAPEHDHVF